YYSVARSLARRAGEAKVDAAGARPAMSAAVRDSVRHHLVADVPVAVFLSAGLDSGALLGTMAELGARDTLAVTLAFEEFRGAPRGVHWLQPFGWVPGLGAVARRAISSLGGARLGLHPKAAGLFEYGGSWPGAYLLRRSVYMPWELDGLLEPELLEEGLR